MQEQVRIRFMIGNFFMKNWTKGKVHTVKHCEALQSYGDNARHHIQSMIKKV